MKNLVTIFFLSVYLLSVTEFYQLLKLPLVFQHFAEHRRDNKDISFLQFLDIHYMHGSPHDKDHAKDMQLPFKTTAVCILAGTPVTIPDSPDFNLPARLFVEKRSYSSMNDYFVRSEFQCNIFQPPRPGYLNA
ncbi:hypothetical protein BH11BAC4_BH11BAC4_05870 [soil metagenome]